MAALHHMPTLPTRALAVAPSAAPQDPVLASTAPAAQGQGPPPAHQPGPARRMAQLPKAPLRLAFRKALTTSDVTRSSVVIPMVAKPLFAPYIGAGAGPGLWFRDRQSNKRPLRISERAPSAVTRTMSNATIYGPRNFLADLGLREGEELLCCFRGDREVVFKAGRPPPAQQQQQYQQQQQRRPSEAAAPRQPEAAAPRQPGTPSRDEQPPPHSPAQQRAPPGGCLAPGRPRALHGGAARPLHGGAARPLHRPLGGGGARPQGAGLARLHGAGAARTLQKPRVSQSGHTAGAGARAAARPAPPLAAGTPRSMAGAAAAKVWDRAAFLSAVTAGAGSKAPQSAGAAGEQPSCPHAPSRSLEEASERLAAQLAGYTSIADRAKLGRHRTAVAPQPPPETKVRTDRRGEKRKRSSAGDLLRAGKKPSRPLPTLPALQQALRRIAPAAAPAPRTAGAPRGIAAAAASGTSPSSPRGILSSPKGIPAAVRPAPLQPPPQRSSAGAEGKESRAAAPRHSVQSVQSIHSVQSVHSGQSGRSGPPAAGPPAGASRSLGPLRVPPRGTAAGGGSQQLSAEASATPLPLAGQKTAARTSGSLPAGSGAAASPRGTVFSQGSLSGGRFPAQLPSSPRLSSTQSETGPLRLPSERSREQRDSAAPAQQQQRKPHSSVAATAPAEAARERDEARVRSRGAPSSNRADESAANAATAARVSSSGEQAAADQLRPTRALSPGSVAPLWTPSAAPAAVPRVSSARASNPLVPPKKRLRTHLVEDEAPQARKPEASSLPARAAAAPGAAPLDTPALLGTVRSEQSRLAAQESPAAAVPAAPPAAAPAAVPAAEQAPEAAPPASTLPAPTRSPQELLGQAPSDSAGPARATGSPVGQPLGGGPPQGEAVPEPFLAVQDYPVDNFLGQVGPYQSGLRCDARWKQVRLRAPLLSSVLYRQGDSWIVLADVGRSQSQAVFASREAALDSRDAFFPFGLGGADPSGGSADPPGGSPGPHGLGPGPRGGSVGPQEGNMGLQEGSMGPQGASRGARGASSLASRGLPPVLQQVAAAGPQDSPNRGSAGRRRREGKVCAAGEAA